MEKTKSEVIYAIHLINKAITMLNQKGARNIYTRRCVDEANLAYTEAQNLLKIDKYTYNE